MSEADPLTLAELEAYGRVWGEGRERRALCPFCDHPKRDREHATLAFNAESGAWTCHRCGRSGLLGEYKTPSESERSHHKKGRRPGRRRTVDVHTLAHAHIGPADPAPAEDAEDVRKRARLRRLWTAALPLADPLAVGGRVYLERRGIPADVALAARTRFAYEWGSANTYLGPAVAFPLQDESGRLVAAEGRFVTPPAGVAKSHSAGAKSRGVFEAMPGALEADGVTLCEGPITALAVAACGFPAVALCGHVVRPWLVRRLALRTVFLSLDWYETGAEESAAAATRALAGVGAKVYRLAPPDGAGDWADYLQAVGLATMRAELDAAIVGALVPH